jgi:peptidoglycan/LPS O-acetylase OafA/YrhL
VTVPAQASPVARLPISIGTALRGHDNSLGLIRLIMASAVIFHHSFPLLGIAVDPFQRAARDQASIGAVAVAGFFAISGYLIAKSGANSDGLQFIWRRVLRIFPAYWTVLLVTAFVVGPVLWMLLGRNLGTYFQETGAGPWHYFTANWTLTIGTYGIHDLLAATTPYGQTVGASVFNGSLWTLYYEWICYLLIAVLVVFGVLSRARVLVPIVTAFLFAARVINEVTPGVIGNVAPFLSDGYRVSLTLTFMLGATIAVYSKTIPFDDRLGILSGLVFFATLRFGGYSTIGTVAGVYFIIYLGARLPKAVHFIGQKNDYSYGVYIYGFLVQQVLVHFGGGRLGYLGYSLAALAITFLCAWLSWHLVEKNFMRLKDWGPGLGVVSLRDRIVALRHRLGARGRARAQARGIPAAGTATASDKES